MAADDKNKRNNNILASRAIVHYRSSALDAVKSQMGPSSILLPAGRSSDVLNCPGVIAAAEMAERARAQFKETKKHTSTVEGGIGKAEKYDRRTKLNRQSAAASRLRKEAYIQALEQQLLLHDERNKQLEADLRDERVARIKLQEEVFHGTHPPKLEDIPDVPDIIDIDIDNIPYNVPVQPVGTNTTNTVSKIVATHVSTTAASSTNDQAPSAEGVAVHPVMFPISSTTATADASLLLSPFLGMDLDVPLEPMPFDLLDEGR